MWWPAASSPQPWATRRANRERVADAVCHAVSLGARIVVLPELVSSGYVFEDRAEAAASAEPTDGETLTLWARLAADHQIVIVGGFCELAAAGEVFNSAALIDRGGLRSVYRKAHLWDAETPPVLPREHPSSRGFHGVRPHRNADLLRPGNPRMGTNTRPGRCATALRPASTGPRSHAPTVSDPRRSCACKRTPP